MSSSLKIPCFFGIFFFPRLLVLRVKIVLMSSERERGKNLCKLRSFCIFKKRIHEHFAKVICYIMVARRARSPETGDGSTTSTTRDHREAAASRHPAISFPRRAPFLLKSLIWHKCAPFWSIFFKFFGVIFRRNWGHLQNGEHERGMQIMQMPFGF